jgi:aerobic-type carbon monoxide dehydrogenase small subunit (CoxS/CutS family)
VRVLHAGICDESVGPLDRNPQPTESDVKKACSGNLCRCGSYPRVFEAALQAAGVKTEPKTEVIRNG